MTYKNILCIAFVDPDTPTKPTVSDEEQMSVRLSWQPGESQVINRTSVVYRKTSELTWQRQNVMSSSPGDVRRTRRSAAAEPRVFELGGLDPDTEYLVRIEVESFGKISRSPLASFTTRELCYLLPRFHDQANIEQSSSKHPANAFRIHVHDVCSNCSMFARRLLDVCSILA